MADWLRGVRCLGPARMAGRLLDLGAYPGALPGEGAGEIVGELLEIDDADLLARLDRYEGYRPERPEASLFVRVEAEVTLPGGRRQPCYAYVFAGDPGDAPEIPGGDWSARAGSRGAARWRR